MRAYGWPIDTRFGPHYTDVPASYYAYAAIETCTNRQAMLGAGSGLFVPNRNIDRAELAAVLYRVLTLPLAYS